MLSFFRRIIYSRVGVVVTIGVLVVIALAFGLSDITGLRSGSGGIGGDTVATVGGKKIGAGELKQRVQQELDGFRQQQPTLDMATFVAQGGLDGTLDRMVTGMSLAAFGADNGMVVSKRTVDGQLASIPGLQAPNGSFDMAVYQRLLADRKLTDAIVRGDIARQAVIDQLTLPTQGAAQVPMQLALPYASLLLEKRAGEVAFVPTRAMGAGTAPTNAELQGFYQRNIQRYTVPERRVVRYAEVTPETVAAQAVPSAAEIAAAYRAAGTRFQATQKRTVESVVAADQQTANSIAAKAKAGTPLADAARAAGLEASTQASVEKPAFATATSPAIADAVFAAGANTVLGPLKSPLGWTVARVTSIQEVAGRSLAQATPELTTELTAKKQADALAGMRDALDEALTKNATFDEVVADRKLAARTTPALLASGVDPEKPTVKADPAIAPILTAAFQAEEGDDPQIVQTAPNGSFAVVALSRIVRAAPRPLAAVRADVVRDFSIDRARGAARKLADTIVAAVNKGTPLASAVAKAGVALPPVRPLSASRAQVASQRSAAAPLMLLFSMKQGTAKLVEAPQQGGWFVVKLDQVQSGDARGNPGVVNAARADLGRVVGREYVEQFARAVRADVGAKTDAGAVARVRSDLLGGGNSN